jgi:hypothetical protein
MALSDGKKVKAGKPDEKPFKLTDKKGFFAGSAVRWVALAF